LSRSKVTRSKKISVESKKIFFTYTGEGLNPKHSKLYLYDAVMDLLHQGYYKSEIARILNVSKQRIYYICKKLEAAGFIERTDRTSIVQYRVYYKTWKSHLKLLEGKSKVKKSELGEDGLSLHNFKFRFPVRVPNGRRIRRIQWTTPDGVGIDVNNQSIIVWVPRFMFDSKRHKKYPGKEGWDAMFRAAVKAYQVAEVVANRVGLNLDLGNMEILPPIHVAAEFYMDFSKKVMELETVIFGKSPPAELPRRRLDYYI